MKNKKWLAIILTAIALVLSIVLFVVFGNQDKNTTLTIMEKRWIESNKNKVIDFGILNNTAILNYEGDGVFFDFLESLENVTELGFNKVSYEYGDKIKDDYSFRVTDKVGKKDILLYTDNYIVLSKNNFKYNKLSDINDLTLGVLNENIEEVNNYINNSDLLFKSYDKIDDLIAELSKEDSSIDAIILPKLVYLSQRLETKFYINYNITEMQDNYVISLGSIDKLNDIIKKYYRKWYSENYDDSYAKHFTSTYFALNEVDEQSKAKFRSKRYVYGFVNNAPFDLAIDNKLIGTNSSIISAFSKLTNVEVIYKEYNNFDKLSEGFNSNKIDFYYDSYKVVDYDMDTYKTVSPYDEQIALITGLSNNIIINSSNSLKGKTILSLASTKITDYLKKIGADVITYDSIEELLRAKKENTIMAIDLLTYNYYAKDELKNYKVDYQFSLDTDYNYVIRDIKENRIFMKFLDFYLTFTNEKSLINNGYYHVVKSTNNSDLLKNAIYLALTLIAIAVVYVISKKYKPKKKNTMKKEDKLRYVDMLTSLKNRNYLNDSIEKWDESEIYPQTIIIVDLNNVAYINDNYGHQEGDNIIKEAANILITGQMEHSDIIRTNGNEFLIYLVKYDEKQIVSYIRKLNKDFKELSYGFGAAVGYSMINDAIKTIDDAINEATLDMRNNKEELNN